MSVRICVVAVLLVLSAGCGRGGPASSSTGTSGSVTGSSGTGSSATGSSGSGSSGGSTGAGCTGLTLGPGERDEQLTVMDNDPAYPSGSFRTAHLHVPASYDPAVAMPVVILFHGYFEASVWVRETSGFDGLSEQRGFIAVYPEGHDQTWNAGTCCGFSSNENVDDVGFTRALLDDLESKYCIDRKRVFAAGDSNGGMFSLRLGCELSDRMAAVGSVMGNLAIPSCNPGRPTPFFFFHGNQPDGLEPYELTPEATLAAFQQADGLTGASPQVAFNQGGIRCDAYGASGAIVDCVVDGGASCWPTTSPDAGTIGCTSAFDASTQLLDFFASHPMP